MKITKPNKNRKIRYNAPNHLKRKYFSAPLSPSLKTQYGAKKMSVRLDDTVMVTKGDRKLSEGKVIRVDSKKCKLYIEGLTRTKLDGSTVPIPIRPRLVSRGTRRNETEKTTRTKTEPRTDRGQFDRRSGGLRSWVCHHLPACSL